jgi:hypothetical protein
MTELNEFDTNYTLLYKSSYTLGEPAKYIIYQEDGTYKSIFKIINEKILVSNIFDIWSEFKNKNFSLLEFCFIYFSIAIKENISLDEALSNINSLIETLNENEATDAYEGGIKFKTFETLNDLKEGYQIWLKSYQREKIKDEQIYNNIVKVQKTLSETPKTAYKDLDINNLSLEYVTKYEDRIPNKFDGITIFNIMTTNIYIPYIQWNDPNGKKYYKVYENDDMKNYEVLLNHQFRKINTLYFLVLVEEPEETITKKTYTKCSYFLDTGKIRVSLPVSRKDIVMSRIKKELVNIKFSEEKEFNLKGSFRVPGLNMDPAVISFLLLNDNDEFFGLDSILSTYLYIDESKSSIVNSDLIRIRYKTIEASVVDEDDEEDAESSNISSAMISFHENEEIVNIVKVKSREILDHFMLIFSRLLTIYENNRGGIEEFIQAAVPEEKFDIEKKEGREKKLAALKAVAPDVFITGAKGYARKCACNKQPIIVDDVDAKDWKNHTFYSGATELNRQVATFPPKSKDSMFKFVCPDDEFPYPAMIENTETNKDKYPYVPCCAAEDNINNENSFYNNYFKPVQDKETGASKGYKINTMKVLSYEARGNIPKKIQDLLNSVNPNEKYVYERFGVGRSPNSLIHCVLVALQDLKYTTNTTSAQKEAYAIKVRKSLLTKFKDLSLFKQELFDMTDGEIEELINNETLFFDPALFYRGLEELFEINIFVLEPGVEEDQDPRFEIPRHKLLHIRPYIPERRTVVIMKHKGGEAEDLKYAQCELIVNTGEIIGEEKEQEGKKKRGRPKNDERMTKEINKSSATKFIFDMDITEVLYESFQSSVKNYLFTFRPKDIVDKQVEMKYQPYSKIRWTDLFETSLDNPYGMSFDYQNVDNYGKARSFTLKFGTKEKTLRMTLFVPPTQPLNIPSRNEIYYSQKEVVEAIFGTPKAETKDGYWYSILGFEYGFFVPCETGIKSGTVQNIPIQLQYAKEMNRKPNPIQNYRSIKKYAKILIDMIIWGLRSNGILNYNDFMKDFKKYVEIDNSVNSDSLPTTIYRKLPDKANFIYLASLWPEYFTKSNKVRLSESLYEKLSVYLKRYYVETDGLSLPPNPYLENVYEYEWDFTPHPHTRVLIDETHFESWVVYYKNKKNTGNMIYTLFDLDLLRDSNEPILFKDEKSSKVYIIQNVQGRDKETALNLAEYWKQYKFNFGYSPPKFKDVLQKAYVVHGITYDYKLDLEYVRNIKEETAEDYLQVLHFENDYYAAMLPIH